MKTKYLFLSLILMSITGNILQAQNKKIRISGKVIEAQSQQAVEFATVMIADPETNKMLQGTTTDIEGNFKISSPQPNFNIQVSFIGFETKIITDFTIKNGKVDLGNVSLGTDSEMLEEVVVTTEKSQTEFRLDKRVFNVGQDISSSGAGALEVLNNVPSVDVNIEGEISLRGSSGVQILINGKPSVLASEQGNALGSITAEMIEKIEVITNPSAKYEAEGTSGIINIVLKKEERKGMNGSISVNTGIPHNHSVGLSLNRRTEKFNLFSQLGVGYRSLPRDNENINENRLTGTRIESEGTSYRNENFYNITLGADYHIDDLNVLTLSGNFAYEVEDQPSETDFISLVDGETSMWQREEETEATNPKWQYELQYKKEFQDSKDHNLLLSALGNFFGKDQSSYFENLSLSGKEPSGDQRTATNFKEAKFTFNVDYTKPIDQVWTIETGAQYVLQDVSNDYSVTDFIDQDWVLNTGLTNLFEYQQNVLGVYGTGAYEGEKWGLKAGLRVENTDLNTLLTNTGVSDDQNYTNLFPSVHTSYKFSERISLQAGYSKRIYRPRLWDLNPFFNVRNNFAIYTGNPDLDPEFTDSYEINSIYILDDLTFNFGVYHRYTTDVIERVSQFVDDVNLTQPINVGTNKATGVEFNAKYIFTKWLTVNGDFNYNYFNRKGTFEERVFDFDADRWMAKVTSKLKLPKDWDIELTANYRSAFETFQSVYARNIFADFGLRKKLNKGKSIISLSIRDIFASRFRESEIDDEDFYLYSYGQRGRFITLGFSYGFGKGEAMQYSGRRR